MCCRPSVFQLRAPWCCLLCSSVLFCAQVIPQRPCNAPHNTRLQPLLPTCLPAQFTGSFCFRSWFIYLPVSTWRLLYCLCAPTLASPTLLEPWQWCTCLRRNRLSVPCRWLFDTAAHCLAC